MLSFLNSAQTDLPYLVKNGDCHWRCPSNIAITKYWGKRDIQIPMNPSVSITLSECYTETKVIYTNNKKKGTISLEFTFEGKPNVAFQQKIENFLESLSELMPFLKDFHLQIESSNSFPHSSGIASSASSMGALALCLCEMERQILGTLNADTPFFHKASYIARLGSGSACRSIYPVSAWWGEEETLEDSSNEVALPLKDVVFTSFSTLCDTILLVSDSEKKVSSRVGHSLMNTNPYSEIRFKEAHKNSLLVLEALKNGDWETFGNIAEQEALQLHAMMMASQPPFILMQPHTLKILELIMDFRKQTHTPCYFTLDAGPNVHLLYPKLYEDEVRTFVESTLLPYCQGKKVIFDHAGFGPKNMKHEL